MENISSDEFFMKKALNEAEIAFERGDSCGAVIVVNNTVIASHNLTELLNVTAICRNANDYGC
jgi:tRNA(adenine34) deaminase